MEDIRPKVRQDTKSRGAIRVPRRALPNRRPKNKPSIKHQTILPPALPFQPTGFLDGVVAQPKNTAVKKVSKPIAQPAEPKPKHAKPREKSHLSRQFTHKHQPKTYKKTSSSKPKKWLQHLATLVAVLVLIVSGYIGIDVWFTNQEVKQVTATDGRNSDEEGKDESKISSKTVDDYNVAPDLPRVLSIPSQVVKARVLQMDVKTNNQLKAPLNIYDAGWYMGSAKPGNYGAILIDGHVSGPTQSGVFKNIKSLQQGDIIKLDNGAKQEFSYKVDKVETVLEGEVDMTKMLQPYKAGGKGLNLITCGGKFDSKTQTYDSRTLVYTTQVE